MKKRESKRKREKTRVNPVLCVVLLCIAVLVAFVIEHKEQKEIKSGKITIQQEEKAGEELQLEVKIEGEEGEKYVPYTYQIPEKGITEREAFEKMERVRKELETSFLGENRSMSAVCMPVKMRESYSEPDVVVEWSVDAPDIVGFDGNIYLEEGNKEVCATANIKCGSYHMEDYLYFTVYPAEKTVKEQIDECFEETFSDQINQQKVELELPKEIEGKRVQWRRPKEYLPLKIFLYGVFLAAIFHFWSLEKGKQTLKKIQKNLLEDYPGIITKYKILLGIGMTFQEATQKITNPYLDERKKMQTEQREGYANLVTFEKRVREGESERIALKKMADEIGEENYRRFARLMIQNLSKGSVQLNQILEQEVMRSYQEKRNDVKKRAQEVDTKLLLPMMLLLCVVIVVVVAPVLLNMSKI